MRGGTESLRILGVEGPTIASPLATAPLTLMETWCLPPKNALAVEAELIAALKVLYGVGEGVRRRREDVASSFR